MQPRTAEVVGEGLRVAKPWWQKRLARSWGAAGGRGRSQPAPVVLSSGRKAAAAGFWVLLPWRWAVVWNEGWCCERRAWFGQGRSLGPSCGLAAYKRWSEWREEKRWDKNAKRREAFFRISYVSLS